MSIESAKTDILVIDDEYQIRRLLRMVLEDTGYAVREAESAAQGLAEAARDAADIIILDLGLPDRSGIDVLRDLRAWNQAPVLILSVFGQEGSKIAALDAGADDYLTKPFGSGELLARLRALQRRIKPAVATSFFRFGNVEIDFTNRQVSKNRQPVRLTSTEYALLLLFITHRGRVMTHRQILRDVWGPNAETQTHYLRTYLLRLRKKLEDDLDNPRYFQTDSGIGYRFVSDPIEAI